MCSPLAAASLAFSALTTGIEYAAQSAQADATNDYQRQVSAINRRNTLEAYRSSINQETARALQSEASAVNQIEQGISQRRRAMGTALASSESAGLSFDALLGDYLRQEGNFKSQIVQQLDWERQQSQENMKGYQAQANDRLASYTFQPATGPSLAASLAGFGEKALGTYNAHRFQDGVKE
jgi:hypothetical protein